MSAEVLLFVRRWCWWGGVVFFALGLIKAELFHVSTSAETFLVTACFFMLCAVYVRCIPRREIP